VANTISIIDDSDNWPQRYEQNDKSINFAEF